MIDIFYIVILILSVVVHEYMHGWMADRLGDRTARASGRLTLNPIPHIDPIGSILVPIFLWLTHSGIMFGWAKPVPFNPYNLRDQRYGTAKVGAAGPLSNLTIALVFGLLLRFLPESLGAGVFGSLITVIVFVNLVLGIINLVPIPPLDGSRILAPFLPIRLRMVYESMEQYGLIIMVLFLWLGAQYLFPLISYVYTLLTGYYF
jgi:Zn-dependent protease